MMIAALCSCEKEGGNNGGGGLPNDPAGTGLIVGCSKAVEFDYANMDVFTFHDLQRIG